MKKYLQSLNPFKDETFDAGNVVVTCLWIGIIVAVALILAERG